jgi:adenylate kinase
VEFFLMHVIFMGPQGVGKGTQAVRVASELGLIHLSTGDLFRAAIKAETPLGQQVKSILDAGELVPDAVTLGIVEARLDEIEAAAHGAQAPGALYDGFPRTPAQAEGLDTMLARRGESVALVVEITAPRDVLIERLAGRRVCKSCGATYHATFNPPKIDGVCDRCGGVVEQRKDDTPDAIKTRLALYDEQTAPLLQYYTQQGKLVTVDGDREIAAVSADLVRVISAAIAGA